MVRHSVTLYSSDDYSEAGLPSSVCLLHTCMSSLLFIIFYVLFYIAYDEGFFLSIWVFNFFI